MYQLKLYLATWVVFILTDALWLGVIARSFYREQLGPFLREDPNWIAAAVFYFVFVGGVVFFSINPSLEKASVSRAIVLGAFFGFITYATYDLTNLATMKGWPLMVTLVDLAWGTFLGGWTSAMGFMAGRWLR